MLTHYYEEDKKKMGEGLQMFCGWLSLLGVPSIFALFGICLKYIRKVSKQITILHNAQKAQMRKELIDQYDYWSAKGYIPAIYLEEFKNQYKAYMALVGDNEVLEARFKALIALPSKEPDKE